MTTRAAIGCNGKMKIDLLQSMAWEDWNDRFRHEFAEPRAWVTSADQQGRMYRGLAHAVSEVVLGSALFLSHKKSITVIRGETWAFESVLPQLYKMGMQVQEVPRHQIHSWEEWVNELPPETNCVLWAEDHPITGEYEDRSALAALLSKKRITSVVVTHDAFWTRPHPVETYGVRLYSLEPSATWGILGARVRTPPLFAHRMEWQEAELQALQARLNQGAGSENEDRVRSFEKAVLASNLGFEIFPFQRDRLWDRSVIYHPEYNGDALLQAWEKSPVAGEAAAPDQSARSLVRCSAGSIPELRTWWDPLPAPERLRGLLVLGLDALGTEKLDERLRQALDASSFRVN